MPPPVAVVSFGRNGSGLIPSEKWMIAETNLSGDPAATGFFYILTDEQIIRCFLERHFANSGFKLP